MNYIGKLQTEKLVLEGQIRDARREITAMRAFLSSPKFTGVETDGSRKDWISTGDVNRLLDGLDEALIGVR